MPISVVCQCGAKLNAKDELAGRSVKCPKCSQLIKIPAAAGAPAATPAKPAAPAKPVSPETKSAAKAPTKPAPSKATKPAEADSLGGLLDEMGVAAAPVKHDIACPKCGAGMKEGAVLCVACGFNTKTGKQIATSSDSAAIAKREAYFEQQAAKAEAQQAKILGAGGGGTAKSKTSSKSSSDAGSELSTIDYIFCIFCGGIALIVSIIYCVTGNPKGPPMLKLVLIVQGILFVLGVVLQLVAMSMIPAQ